VISGAKKRFYLKEYDKPDNSQEQVTFVTDKRDECHRRAQAGCPGVEIVAIYLDRCAHADSAWQAGRGADGPRYIYDFGAP
jgi:hypothetical protein